MSIGNYFNFLTHRTIIYLSFVDVLNNFNSNAQIDVHEVSFVKRKSSYDLGVSVLGSVKFAVNIDIVL